MRSGGSAENGWFRALVEMPGGPAVLLHDPLDGLRVVYANEAACRHFGLDLAGLCQMSPADFDPAATPGEMQQALDRARALPGYRFETQHLRADGTRVPVEVLLSYVRAESGDRLASMIFDLSVRKAAEHALQQSHLDLARRETDRRYAELFDNFGDGIALLETGAVGECRVMSANPAFLRDLGLPAEAVRGQLAREVFPPALALFVQQLGPDRPETQTVRHGELQLICAGREACFAVSLIPMADLARMALVVRDVGPARVMERSLAAREREYRLLVENSPDTIARYDRECRRLYVNTALALKSAGGREKLLGARPGEFPGSEEDVRFEQVILAVFADGADQEIELSWPMRNGVTGHSLIRLTAERDAAGEIVSVLGVGRDITELVGSRQRIQQMAYFDLLTGLPNRARFTEQAQHTMARAAEAGAMAALMVLDIDRFKSVNDSFGHPAGDALLCQTATRLRTLLPEQGMLARLGGDEFAILPGVGVSREDCSALAAAVLQSFAEPFMLENREVVVSASLGIALFPADGEAVDDLVKFADSAMYHVKRSGRNDYCFYARKLTESVREQLMLETGLRKAVARGELELHFQPKLRLADGTLEGSEALLRWNHPERGLIAPTQFIPLAEETGLIVEVGDWVLREACRVAREWNARAPHRLAINLSARQFRLPDLVERLRRTLDETGCQPEWIEIEITESLLLDDDCNVLQTLLSFREMGIGIAIDDFGTGYSALSYLAHYPITTLKIDRSFVSQVDQGSYAELVKAMLSIARCLRQQVVAEGVETPEQAEFLLNHGCDMAQGYLFGRPMPREEFEHRVLAFTRGN